MNRLTTLFVVASLLVSGPVIGQQSGQAVMVQYGTVEGVKLIKNPGKATGGAIVGGLAGAAIADDHRGLGMLAGGLIGGGIEKHHTAGTLNQYTITMITGGELVVNSDQNDLIVGDCVVVEKGEYTNVRRVSSVNCQLKQQPAAHHVKDADNCQAAKDELNKAKTDDAIEMAVVKVRTLCED